MERFQRRAGKQVQNKESTATEAKGKKPMKVVYISNPKRVETSAEDFRSLVQKLTGQHSDVADLAEFPDQYQSGNSISVVSHGTHRRQSSDSSRTMNNSAYVSSGVYGEQQQQHYRMGTQNSFESFGYDAFNAPVMMDGYGTGGFHSYDGTPQFGAPFGSHHEPWSG